MSSSPKSVPPEVLARWSAFAGRSSRPHGTGLSNQTFVVEGAQGKAIVQAHGLTVGEQLSERRAFGDMSGRHVERALGFCDIVHAVAKPAIGEAGTARPG